MWFLVGGFWGGNENFALAYESRISDKVKVIRLPISRLWERGKGDFGYLCLC